MKKVVDCADVKTEGEFWQAYIRDAQPDGVEFFGRNVAAFWDAVSGGGPGWPGECELHFINTQPLRLLNGGQFYASLKRIANESEFVKIYLQ
jgi:ribonuclease inhibitor